MGYICDTCKNLLIRMMRKMIVTLRYVWKILNRYGIIAKNSRRR